MSTQQIVRSVPIGHVYVNNIVLSPKYSGAATDVFRPFTRTDLTNLLTNSTDQSLSWQANTCPSNSQAVLHVMEPDGSLPCLQQPADSLYPETGKSSSCPPILFLYDQFQYYPPIYAYVFQVVSFLQISQPKPSMYFCPPHTCHMPCLPRPPTSDHPHNIR